jgi:two-component sensor histidine kinase
MLTITQDGVPLPLDFDMERSDQEWHGVGLKIVKLITQQLQGHSQLFTKEDWTTFNLQIPLES